MLLRMIMLVCCLLVPQFSFATPMAVPPEKSAYVGDWQGKAMRLAIAQDGKIEYKRDRPGKNLSIHIELVRFDGDNFEAGANTEWFKVASTFVVSKPPYRDGDKWKMVVDGVELTKVE
jgi:hypothetical protein